MKRKQMHLKVLLPSEVLVDIQVSKIIAEAENGFFCLLPKHVDFVAALIPSILYYFPLAATSQKECFVAINEGALVKCGADVLVSVQDALVGEELASLRLAVEQRFHYLNEQEKTARSALARLEAGVVRHFIEMY